MQTVNLNHAATSGSKPKEVTDALVGYLTDNQHTSAGRGGDELVAVEAALEARLALAELFAVANPGQVIFTSGATESLNMLINGLAREGCHVLASGLEHNAVARPLHLLQQQGKIEVTWLPCTPDGLFNPQAIAEQVRPNTRFLVMTHASNVLGNILPVKEAFAIARQCGLFTVLDAAQTAGHLPVRLDEHVDAIAFTGHKGLRAVAGCGGIILNKAIAGEINVWKAGGTGSISHSLDMPDFLPDRFEPGTPNMLGILSLRAAVAAIQRAGFADIRAHEMALTTRFVDGVRQLPVSVYGGYVAENWMPVVSINIPGRDSGEVARQLSAEYGIQIRSGLHCSPLAHKSMGTFPGGTLRFSFGMDTSAAEIDYALEAIGQLATKKV